MEGPEAAYAQGDLYADVMAGPPQIANGQVKIKKEVDTEDYNSTVSSLLPRRIASSSFFF